MSVNEEFTTGEIIAGTGWKYVPIDPVEDAKKLLIIQIEKMKCCGNCKHCDSIDRAPICYVYESKENLAWDICEKWEIRG